MIFDVSPKWHDFGIFWMRKKNILMHDGYCIWFFNANLLMFSISNFRWAGPRKGEIQGHLWRTRPDLCRDVRLLKSLQFSPSYFSPKIFPLNICSTTFSFCKFSLSQHFYPLLSSVTVVNFWSGWYMLFCETHPRSCYGVFLNDRIRLPKIAEVIEYTAIFEQERVQNRRKCYWTIQT